MLINDYHLFGYGIYVNQIDIYNDSAYDLFFFLKRGQCQTNKQMVKMCIIYFNVFISIILTLG